LDRLTRDNDAFGQDLCRFRLVGGVVERFDCFELMM
jgi:hypothetical protein